MVPSARSTTPPTPCTSSAPGTATNSTCAPASIPATPPCGCARRRCAWKRGKSLSAPEPARRNDPAGWVEPAAAGLLRLANELIERGEAARISDEAVAQLMTAAIRLYVAKTDG